MIKKWSFILAFLVVGATAFSQTGTADTVIVPANNISEIDTSIDYDELFRDFDDFMDSILTPRSYLLGSLSVGKGYSVSYTHLRPRDS